MKPIKLSKNMYNSYKGIPLSNKDEKSFLEQARDNLSKMKQMEECKSDKMHTIVLSNGTCISSTSLETLNEYESKYARMGVKVKRRY